MILFPNAKINIGLNIIERRADGYHNIETVMFPIKWYDILEIVPAKGDKSTLTVTGRNIDCPTEKNLVMKAVNLFKETYNTGNVDIFLHKIIPDGAGLGGGSSDAAFALKGLNEIFNCNISDTQLAAMASKIGADCPFFIYNEPQLATGIGTDFSPIKIDLNGYKILVVKPQVSVPTAKAYSGVTPKISTNNLEQSLLLPVDNWKEYIVNDFENSVFPAYPEISALKQIIQQMGAIYVSMSGSGSSVYGIFAPECDILADNINERFPECDTFFSEL